MENTLIKLTLNDETKKRAQNPPFPILTLMQTLNKIVLKMLKREREIKLVTDGRMDGHVLTCPRCFMRFIICTAMFSVVRVRLGLVQHGVMGLKWACGVHLARLAP